LLDVLGAVGDFEIKALDDEIADCTQHVEQERRAEQRASSTAAKLLTTSK